MQHARWLTVFGLVGLVALWPLTSLSAQGMKGMKEMKRMEGMGGMKGMGETYEMLPMKPTVGEMKSADSGLAIPNLVIKTLDKQVVVPDKAIPFPPLTMGRDAFAQVIANVDVGLGMALAVRKIGVLPGGHVELMQTTHLWYVEKGLGLLIDGAGELDPRVVPAGSWFTVPADWHQTLRNIGEDPLVMITIRVTQDQKN